MTRRNHLHLLLPGTALLTVAVFIAFAPDHYLPMMLRAFMLPGTIVLALLAMGAWMKKARWTALCAAFGALLMGTQVRTTGRVHPAPDSSTALRVLHMNVLQPNNAYDAVIQQALESGADMLSFQEVGREWANKLALGLGARYPYHHIEARNNCYGIALFSRIPISGIRTLVIGNNPFIEAEFPWEGRPVRLLSVHATSPTSYSNYRRRNGQLEALGAYLDGNNMATIVIGDLNTVPWDRSFRKLCANTGLQPTTPPTQRTWPALGPVALIPLDHVLLSPGVAPKALRTIRIPGSDHRGLLADLSFPPHEQ